MKTNDDPKDTGLPDEVIATEDRGDNAMHTGERAVLANTNDPAGAVASDALPGAEYSGLPVAAAGQDGTSMSRDAALIQAKHLDAQGVPGYGKAERDAAYGAHPGAEPEPTVVVFDAGDPVGDTGGEPAETDPGHSKVDLGRTPAVVRVDPDTGSTTTLDEGGQDVKGGTEVPTEQERAAAAESRGAAATSGATTAASTPQGRSARPTSKTAAKDGDDKPENTSATSSAK